jgi:hypothetical protein
LLDPPPQPASRTAISTTIDQIRLTGASLAHAPAR